MKSQEQHIIDGIINKDEKILRSFYTAHKKQLTLFIYRQFNEQELAEDLTQEIFIDFIEGIRDFRGGSSLKTYLFTIARHKVIDYIRKKKIKKILFSALPQIVVEKAASVLFNDELSKSELNEKIHKTINSLPNDYRVVLRLKYIEGYKVKDIAQKLSLSFKSTESILFRARIAFIKVYGVYEI